MDISEEIPVEHSISLEPLPLQAPIFIFPSSEQVNSQESHEKFVLAQFKTNESDPKDLKAKFQPSSALEQDDEENIPIKEFIRLDTYEDTERTHNNTPQKQKKINIFDYETALIHSRNSSRLVSLFMQEDPYLKVSKAKNTDFNFEKCLKRLEKGYNLYEFDYIKGKPQKVFVSLTKKGLKIKYETKTKEIPLEKLQGVIQGANSSTFLRFYNIGGTLESLGIEKHDCLTVLGKFCNFDFGCLDPRAKYDFFIALSWQISLFANTSHFPISKFTLTKSIFKQKIQEMADEKRLFVSELLMLGILRTLITFKYSEDKQEKIRSLLDKRLLFDMKIYRICMKLKPKHFMPSDSFQQRFWEMMREQALERKMACRITRLGTSKNIDWKNVATNEAEIIEHRSVKRRLTIMKQKSEQSPNKIQSIYIDLPTR